MARVGALATLVAGWLAAAAFLWQTDVPRDLELPALDETHYFDPAELTDHDRHDDVLRALGLAGLVAQLAGAAIVAWRAPRVPGGDLLRAAVLGILTVAAAFVVRLPFALAIVWWQRRSGVARVGYAQWLLDRLPALALRALVLAAAAAVVVALARRLGRRWWTVGAPLFVLAGVGVVLAQPLLTPRTEPLDRPGIVSEIRRVAAQQGIADVRVEVRRQRERTRALSAEALGIGPTTRVVLWDTSLELPRGVLLYLAGHELAHVSRTHVWKGLAWFVLFAFPLTYLLARLVDLRDPRAVPRAILVGVLLVLAITPATSAVSRRYEAEADWVALEATRDPASAVALFVALAEASKRDPTTPRLYAWTFGTHPTIADRIAMAVAFSRRAGPSPGGS